MVVMSVSSYVFCCLRSLERAAVSRKQRRALIYSCRMMFPENRIPLFRIML